MEAGGGHALRYDTKLKLGKRGPGPYHDPIVVVVIRHNAAAAAGRALLLVVSPLVDHASAVALWTRLRHVGLALSGTTTQLAQHNPDRSGNGGRHGQYSGNNSIPATNRIRQRRSCVGKRANLRRDRDE
jgi:hypothetical protein